MAAGRTCGRRSRKRKGCEALPYNDRMASYKAKFEQGHVVFVGLIPPLPEGADVRVVVDDPSPAPPGGEDPFDRLADFAVDTGITDGAAEHDHYIYGSPKRSERKNEA
jgi:hypothetical protein